MPNKSDFNIRDFVARERHAEVFDWICKALGKSPETVASEMLTAAIVREMPAFREAKGGGGQSGRDLAKLAERLR